MDEIKDKRKGKREKVDGVKLRKEGGKKKNNKKNGKNKILIPG